jgi:precorrin-2/cobalt-factor-2 C20-methyltransferase
MNGTLYGVGVGPGDPELLTIKARRILTSAAFIACPLSASEKESVALSIVRQTVDVLPPVLELLFPMNANTAVLSGSWNTAAGTIAEKLKEGNDVAFVTLGDPTIYSTYMHLHQAITTMGLHAEIVPGVTSFCAAAARAGISLVEGTETLAIIPSTISGNGIDQALRLFDNVVLMKVGDRVDALKQLLRKNDRYDDAVLVSRAGLAGEAVESTLNRVPDEGLGYLTTIIVSRRNRNR